MKEFKGTTYPWRVEDMIDIMAGEEHIASIFSDKIEDAQLISAAPELLEALMNVSKWFSKLEDWNGVGDPDLDQIKQAIQKALGE